MPRKRTRKVKRSARKRTTPRSTSNRRRKTNLKFEVKSSVMREIWAIIYFAIAAVTFLSLQGAFGIVGDLWVDLLNPVLGWGIYMLPPIFLLISRFMSHHIETSFFIREKRVEGIPIFREIYFFCVFRSEVFEFF